MTTSSYVFSNANIINRVKKSLRNPYGCITVKEIPLDVPVIVVFGGELAQTERNANACAKQITNLLEENNIYGVSVYAIVYDFGSVEPKLERAEQFKIAGRRLSNNENPSPIVRHQLNQTLNKMRQNEPVLNYVKKLFDIILRPRISDNSNKPLAVIEAVSRIQRIKFVAHCEGAATIWQMSNLMYDEMLKLGYNKKDIQSIQKEMLVIQHGPVAPLDKQKFTTMSFASAEDTMMQNHNNLFADWMYENAADVIPSYFGKGLGNLFVGGKLHTLPFKEHSNTGLLLSEQINFPLTDEGKIIFAAERNAIIRAAQKAINTEPVNSVKEMVDGNGVDFEQLKQNGEILYKLMLNDLYRQNLKRGRQK